MLFWAILVIAAIGFALTRLHRPFVGLGVASIGATLAGCLALAACYVYLTVFQPPRQPRADADWSGFASVILYIFLVPGVSVIIGFGLGLGYAFWREHSLPEGSPKEPGPLDL